MRGFQNVTYRVLDYNRLNNPQLEAQLETQRIRLKAIDTDLMTEAETDILFDISLNIREIKKVLKRREPAPSPFKDR